jgi:3-oxoadipate enol-lactonase
VTTAPDRMPVSRFRLAGADLAYRIVGAIGDGMPPVVLLHGLGGDPSDWSAQIPALDGRCVVIPDLRGFGASIDATGPYSVERHAEDLLGLLRHLGVEVVDLVGHSMGGAIALQFALDHPGRVRRMILVNSLADFRLHGIARPLEYGLRRLIIATLGLRILNRLLIWRNFPRGDQAGIRAMLRDRSASNRKAAYLQAMESLVCWSARDRLTDVRAKTLVVTGELDLTPVSEKTELIDRIPDAELAVVAGSRHGTPIGAAGAFNGLMLEFLGRSSGAEEHVSG